MDVSYRIFPNPANDFIDLETEGKRNCSVSVLDNTGKLVLKETIIQNNTRIDLSSFEIGLYLIQMQNDYKTINKNL
ncbi:MAG: T9SS type A sorting domain-containing protein [Bacteroidetes bacterium]|nr:T9SS type A sorting domain-containing protein [Bacteroidota bacterium]